MRTTAGAAGLSWRGAVAGALAASVVVVPAASAGPAECLMVRDDGRQLVEERDPWRTHDVRGGGLGSDGRRLTATVQLRELPSSPPAAQDALFGYTTYFTVGGEVRFLTVPADSSSEPTYGVLVAGHPVVLGVPTVVRDVASRELRATAPLAGFGRDTRLRTGAVATDHAVFVVAGAMAGPAASQSGRPRMVLDVATEGDRPYRLGDPSCVRVGG